MAKKRLPPEVQEYFRSAVPPEVKEYFREQGKKGGKLGGPARAAKLTPEQRSAIAKKAVDAREAKRAAVKKVAPRKRAAKKAPKREV